MAFPTNAQHNIAVSGTAAPVTVTAGATNVVIVTITSGAINCFLTFDGTTATVNGAGNKLLTSTMHSREFLVYDVTGTVNISVIATGAGTISVESY